MSTGYSPTEWLALLDGELEPVDAARVEAALGDRARERLSSELRLEAGIGDRLASGAACPDLLWARLKKEMATEQPARVKYWQWGLVAAALLAVVSVFLVRANAPAPGYLQLAGSVAQLGAQSDTGAELASVQAYLAVHGVPLTLSAPPAETKHAIRLLGATTEQMQGQEAVVLLYDCCGFPAKVLLVPAGSEAGGMLERANPEGRLQAVHRIDDYIAAVVSEHPAQELLGLLRA